MTELEKALEQKFADVQQKLKDAQTNGATKQELADLHNEVKNQGQAFQDYIEGVKERTIKTVGDQFREFLDKNKDKLEEIRTQKHGVIEFIPKAVGDVAMSSGGDAETPPVNMNTRLDSFNLRNDNDLMQMMTVSNTDAPNLVYSELEPKDGSYAFVAEAGLKPQIDFKWANRYETPKKIAAYEVLSEEVVTDIARMDAVAREHLRKRHDLFKVNSVFFADGTGVKPTGATAYGRTFVAGDMANAVDSPNFMDVVNACVTDIYVTHNYEDEASYMANVCLVNPVDFYIQLVSAKDDNGLPLYPQAGLFNRVNIGGVTILPWEEIPAGKIFVADMKQYRIENYIPYSVRIGWINDQMITNQFTMVGESRFFAYVKRLDRQAFIYDDLETIKTAITKA